MATPVESDLAHCVCLHCPTYVDGDTRLFCVYGKSKRNDVPRGCLCRTCPVHIEGNLEGREYCLRGTPEEQ